MCSGFQRDRALSFKRIRALCRIRMGGWGNPNLWREECETLMCYLLFLHASKSESKAETDRCNWCCKNPMRMCVCLWRTQWLLQIEISCYPDRHIPLPSAKGSGYMIMIRPPSAQSSPEIWVSFLRGGFPFCLVLKETNRTQAMFRWLSHSETNLYVFKRPAQPRGTATSIELQMKVKLSGEGRRGKHPRKVSTRNRTK